MFWTFAGIWNRRTCWSAEASGWRKTSCTLLTLVCTFINSTTDFQRWAGLAKPYIDSETKKHIAYAERRSIIGIFCQHFEDSNQSSIVMIAKYEKSLQISRDGEIHVCARASRDWTEPARWYGGHRWLKNSFALRILFKKKTCKIRGEYIFCKNLLRKSSEYKVEFVLHWPPGYLLVYFLKGGRLPWMGLKIDNIRERFDSQSIISSPSKDF